MTTTLASPNTQQALPSNSLGILTDEIIAVIVAHPDDEGLLESAIRQAHQIGAHIIPITLSSGEASTHGQEFASLGDIRIAESKAAWASVNVASRHYVGLPDGALGSNLQVMTDRLEEVITNQRVTSIITLGPEGYDFHPDHIAVHQAVMAVAGIHRNLRIWGLSREGGDVSLPADLNHKLAWWAHHVTQFQIVHESNANYKHKTWRRMGAYYVEPRSATDLETYSALFTHETYRLYQPD